MSINPTTNPTTASTSTKVATSTKSSSANANTALTADSSTIAEKTVSPEVAQAQAFQDLKMQSIMALLKPTPQVPDLSGIASSLGNAMASGMQARQDERAQRDQEKLSPASPKFEQELAKKGEQGLKEGEGFSVEAITNQEQKPEEPEPVQVTNIESETSSEQG